ncbi:hypothetical protein AAur_3491 [Paenarthrobacter aurescens TC1]|uniref:Uncharacterized protein n=1 Tax=Paenarthrobacter aurescens (strain TC1) TaxID=290340 RepID=A1RAC2_PAEAT|nr:hypothetical protein AAur_3491 [Paenarthrobacter aurescens TC1]
MKPWTFRTTGTNESKASRQDWRWWGSQSPSPDRVPYQPRHTLRGGESECKISSISPSRRSSRWIRRTSTTGSSVYPKELPSA